MRRAQEVLDETQAERSRTLAAFAVTVGDDGAIADLMGLNEREVRLARRTVGRGDARSVAEALLTQAPPKPAAEPVGSLSGTGDPPAAPREEMAARHRSRSSPGTRSFHARRGQRHPWTPSMDSVLLWSWESGVDLQTVAGELGVSVRALLMRVQALADDGMLTLATPVTDVGRSGRHRRQYEETGFLYGSSTTFPRTYRTERTSSQPLDDRPRRQRAARTS
ncbi:hypothetical protein NKH18_13730 [Streptomyces sp. M10(2022)]